MIKPAIQIGNPVIRGKSKVIPVGRITSAKTQKLLTNLIDSMRHHELVGMAAPQIGEGLQLFVTEIRTTRIRKNLKSTDPLRVFINPKIVSLSRRQTVLYEGCGSVAQSQLFGPVRRPEKITVTALNERGEKFTLTTGGLLAKVIQHEYDHLRGIVCLDKLTNTRKVMDRQEYVKKIPR